MVALVELCLISMLPAVLLMAAAPWTTAPPVGNAPGSAAMVYSDKVPTMAAIKALAPRLPFPFNDTCSPTAWYWPVFLLNLTL